LWGKKGRLDNLRAAAKFWLKNAFSPNESESETTQKQQQALNPSRGLFSEEALACLEEALEEALLDNEESEEEVEEAAFEVHPENWATVMLWTRICGLWNYAPMGGIVSLNWPAVLAKFQAMERYEELKIDAEMFRGIELMENTVLSVLASS
jgi:hypothetical protein